ILSSLGCARGSAPSPPDECRGWLSVPVSSLQVLEHCAAVHVVADEQRCEQEDEAADDCKRTPSGGGARCGDDLRGDEVMGVDDGQRAEMDAHARAPVVKRKGERQTQVEGE